MISSARNDVFGNSATVASTRLRRDAASFLLVEGSGATKTLTGIRIILAPWLRNEHAIFRCHCSAPPVGWGQCLGQAESIDWSSNDLPPREFLIKVCHELK